MLLKEWQNWGRLLFSQNTETSSKMVTIASILHQTKELIALLSPTVEQLPNLPLRKLCAFFVYSFLS